MGADHVAGRPRAGGDGVGHPAQLLDHRVRGRRDQRDERARGAMPAVEGDGPGHVLGRRRHVVAAPAVHVHVDEAGQEPPPTQVDPCRWAVGAGPRPVPVIRPPSTVTQASSRTPAGVTTRPPRSTVIPGPKPAYQDRRRALPEPHAGAVRGHHLVVLLRDTVQVAAPEHRYRVHLADQAFGHSHHDGVHDGGSADR